MHNMTSRRERRESKFYSLAEQGEKLCKGVFLYKSEAKNLIKEGFHVERHGTDEKKQLPSTISWENPYEDGIPLLVELYVKGAIKTFPDCKIKNWAQRLYVIASRANEEKAQSELE